MESMTIVREQPTHQPAARQLSTTDYTPTDCTQTDYTQRLAEQLSTYK